jgi:hypothetical protein
MMIPWHRLFGLTLTEKNAPWLMFSADAEKVRYGAVNYRWKSPVSGIVNKLFNKYESEGVIMPYTMEDFQKEIKEEVMGSLTDEDIDRFLKKLTLEDRLKGLSSEDLLKMLTPKEIEAYLRKIKDRPKE